MNRVAAAIEVARGITAQMTPAKRERLEERLAITFEEHRAYQDAQALACAGGKITTDEGLVAYAALGEVHHAERNGGWASGTDLATKVVVTRLVGELLAVRAPA